MLGFDALAKLPLAAASAPPVNAALAATQAGDTLAAAAIARTNGVLDATQAGDTLAAEGIGTPLTSGTLDQAQAGDGLAATGTVRVAGVLAATQAADTSAASGKVSLGGSLDAAQAGNTLAAQAEATSFVAGGGVQAGDTLAASAITRTNGVLNVTQEGDRVDLPQPFVVAPSFGHWVKTRHKDKPRAPKLPDPVQPGEVVIDEAVLLQMEEERLAALVLKAKREALDRVDDLRATPPRPGAKTTLKLDRFPGAVETVPGLEPRYITLTPRPAPEAPPQPRTATLTLRRFDVVENAPEIRARVITLFRPPPPEPLKEPVRGSATLRALGPRHLPAPELAKARTISLRRHTSRANADRMTVNG